MVKIKFKFLIFLLLSILNLIRGFSKADPNKQQTNKIIKCFNSQILNETFQVISDLFLQKDSMDKLDKFIELIKKIYDIYPKCVELFNESSENKYSGWMSILNYYSCYKKLNHLYEIGYQFYSNLQNKNENLKGNVDDVVNLLLMINQTYQSCRGINLIGINLSIFAWSINLISSYFNSNNKENSKEDQWNINLITSYLNIKVNSKEDQQTNDFTKKIIEIINLIGNYYNK